MKRLIRSNASISKNNIIVDFVVELQPAFSDVAASEIVDIVDTDVFENSPAYDAWESFIINVEEAIFAQDYQIVDHKTTSVSKISEYYDLYAKDEGGNLITSCILLLRVSNHKLSKGHPNESRQKLQERANRHKIPSTKTRQRYHYNRVIVNSQTFENYFEALDEVDRLLEQFKKKHSR